MGAYTTIAWTEHTLNPWRGCTKATWEDSQGKTHLHPGCLNCYAEKDMSVKMHGIRWGKGQERVPKAESGWSEPLRWARAAAKAGERRKVFCASLADVLDSEVPDSMRDMLWETIWGTARMCSCGPLCEAGHDHGCEAPRLDGFSAPGLDWLLLTKRPENWQKVPEHIRPLVWLGTSVSDQQTADEWVPRLLAAQGFRYRFLSVEPMVGPVDLSQWIERIDHCNSCGAENPPQGPDRCPACGRTGTLISTWGFEEAERYRTGERYTTEAGQRDVDGKSLAFNWVIVGGESGPKARPCNVDWIRNIVRQCREAGVPCFVKQLGAAPTYDGNLTPGIPMEITDPKGGNPAEWPEDLRVREFPGVRP